MKETQDMMIRFAKIVERHPEVYDHNMEVYKTRQADSVWEIIAMCVKDELNQDCTVEELKSRWKGMRSTFNRYKNRIMASPSGVRKYYLYDAMKFLEPFVKPTGGIRKTSAFKDCVYEDDTKASGNNSTDDWDISVDIKPEIGPETFVTQRLTETDPIDTPRKRKCPTVTIDDDNEDLQFFKSILSDINNFTSKEKRKLKVGILRLIDDIDNERKANEET